MPTLTAEQLDEYLSISGTSINVAEASNKLSQIVSALTPEGAVLINVRNRPRAAIIDITYFQSLLATSEAALHVRLADEAETDRTPYKEAWAEIRSHKQARRAARQKQEAA